MGLGATVLLGSLALGTGPTGGHATPLQAGAHRGQPEGTRVTLSEAEASTLFPILRPDSPLANDSTITGVWIGTSAGDPSIPTMPTVLHSVLIDYSSGVRLWLGSSELTPEAASKAPQQVAENVNLHAGSLPAEVRTILGRPALVLGGAPNDLNFYPGVDLTVDGVEVRLTTDIDHPNPSLTTAEPLVELAETLHA
jgi:hypothetical protein